MTRHPATFENPLCRQVGTELFFPSRLNGVTEAKYAKSVCVECKHIDECREYGLKYMLDGVWGGTSVNERVVMRRALKIIAKPITIERE